MWRIGSHAFFAGLERPQRDLPQRAGSRLAVVLAIDLEQGRDVGALAGRLRIACRVLVDSRRLAADDARECLLYRAYATRAES